MLHLRDQRKGHYDLVLSNETSLMELIHAKVTQLLMYLHVTVRQITQRAVSWNTLVKKNQKHVDHVQNAELELC